MSGADACRLSDVRVFAALEMSIPITLQESSTGTTAGHREHTDHHERSPDSKEIQGYCLRQARHDLDQNRRLRCSRTRFWGDPHQFVCPTLVTLLLIRKSDPVRYLFSTIFCSRTVGPTPVSATPTGDQRPWCPIGRRVHGASRRV